MRDYVFCKGKLYSVKFGESEKIFNTTPEVETMNNELLATLEYIEQDRGISKAQLIDAIEKALLTAAPSV